MLAAEQITTALFQRKAKGSFSQDSDRAPLRASRFALLRKPGAGAALSSRMEPQARLAFGINVLREMVSRLAAAPDAWLGPAQSPGSKSNSATTTRASAGGSRRSDERTTSVEGHSTLACVAGR